MSDTAIIVLIVAAAVIVALFIFRRQLSKFIFKASREGLEAELTTHPPEGARAPEDARPPETVPAPAPAAPAAAPQQPTVSLRGNVQQGADHVIDVRRDGVEVVENLQEGEGQEISVGPDEG